MVEGGFPGRKGGGGHSRLKEHEQRQRGEETQDTYPIFLEKLNYRKSQRR